MMTRTRRIICMVSVDEETSAGWSISILSIFETIVVEELGDELAGLSDFVRDQNNAGRFRWVFAEQRCSERLVCACDWLGSLLVLESW